MTTPWPDPKIIDGIAFALAGLAPDLQEKFVVNAFKRAIANHPHVIEPEYTPQLEAFVRAIFKRIAEIERMEAGNA